MYLICLTFTTLKVLESTVSVITISLQSKTKYKRILKAKETRSLKLNNRSKSEFFQTNIYVSVGLKKRTKLRAWLTVIVKYFFYFSFKVRCKNLVLQSQNFNIFNRVQGWVRNLFLFFLQSASLWWFFERRLSTHLQGLCLSTIQ